MNIVIRLIQFAAGSILALFLAAGIWVAFTIPTGQDSRASNVVREDFIAASTNILAGEKVRIASSSRRGKTVVIVIGNLAEERKRMLEALVDQVGRGRNRPAPIEFRPEPVN